MAQKPLRPCRHPGCPELTREGWCAKHKPRPPKRRVSAEWHRLYNLPVWWDDLRPTQLLKEPWCRECAKEYPADDPRHRTKASVVDHIKPHRGDMALFTDRNNLQSLCKRHHDQKTMRENCEERKKTGQF